jgi:hypothetical protein
MSLLPALAKAVPISSALKHRRFLGIPSGMTPDKGLPSCSLVPAKHSSEKPNAPGSKRDGASRPTTNGRTVAILAKITAQLRERVQTETSMRGITTSRFVQEALEHTFADLDFWRQPRSCERQENKGGGVAPST